MFSSVVVLNGPSSKFWTSHQFKLPLFGCNLAWQDFEINHCCCIDYETVKNLDQMALPKKCEFYTRNHPKISDRWNVVHAPGIDSGSFALSLALNFYSGSVLVIGGDGQLGQDYETNYDYQWAKKTPTERIYALHRRTFIDLCSTDRVTWVSEHTNPTFKTITKERAKTLV